MIEVHFFIDIVSMSVKFSIDNFFAVPVSNRLAPFLHQFGVTPNHVTIANMVLRVYILCLMLQRKNKLLIFFLLLLTHYLDCLDGSMARMYNQSTRLGAFLDSVSDGVFWGMVLFTILFQCAHKTWILTIVYLFMMTLAITVSLCYFQNNCLPQKYIDNTMFVIITIAYYLYREC